MNKTQFWIILSIFIITVSCFKIYSGDVYWHIQLGKTMVQDLHYPDFTKYYFTPSNGRVVDTNTHWLGDILLYFTYYLGGDYGLNLLRLLIVFGCCYLFYLIVKDRLTSYHLFILMMFVVGTYQKQVLRNSIFSFFFSVLLFYLWFQYRYEKRKYVAYIFVPFLNIWACIHGGFLFGWCMLALLFADDAVRNFKQAKTNFFYIVILVASFATISLHNPYIYSYISLSKIKGIVSYKASSDNISDGIKERLNQTVFKPGNVKSCDFASPFTRTNQPFVLVSMLFGIFGCIVVLSQRKYVLPLIGALIFGLGYLRGLGYICVTVTAISYVTTKTKNNKYFTIVPILLAFFMVANVILEFPIKIGSAYHTFGFGRHPIFNDKNASLCLWDKDLRYSNTFTTIANGGYLLNKWYPYKKVFIDGFFAPHKSDVMKTYTDVKFGNISVDELYDRYNVTSALVELKNGTTNTNFLNSNRWIPRSIDTGSILYVFLNSFFKHTKPVSLLITEKEFAALPKKEQADLINYTYLIAINLYRKGYKAQAVDFIINNKEFFKKHMDLADAVLKNKMIQIRFAREEACYGK